jgi:hypothetical protein
MRRLHGTFQRRLRARPSPHAARQLAEARVGRLQPAERRAALADVEVQRDQRACEQEAASAA